jgi:hypothetical protein
MIAVPNDQKRPASGRAKLLEINILASSSLFGIFCGGRFSRSRASQGFWAGLRKKFHQGYLTEAGH